jgi:type I restriction enzyme S subunit
MMRLRSLIRLNPSKTEVANLPQLTEVTFAPMDALADGLGGLDTSLSQTLGAVETGSYSYFRDGDLLLAKVTPCFENGKKALAQHLTSGIGFATSEVHVIRPDTAKLDPRYLLFLFSSEDFRAAGAESMTGAGGLKRVSEEAVLNYRLPVEDLERQKAIVDFLDRETVRIDKLIKNRERFLDLIAEKKAVLAEQAVNGNILRNAVDGEQGWFGRLPADWPVRRAKILFRERQERSESGDEELLTVSHITGVTKRSEKDVNMFMAESMEGYKLVSRGDVVINTMWAWMGAMGVSSIEGLISPSYGVYSPTSGAFEPGYLDLLLRSRPFIAEATRRSKGIHSSRLRLYPDAFLDIVLPVPSLDAQGAILNALRVATEQEEKLAVLSRRSLALLREFRSSLVTAAVAGRIDVMTWSKRGTVNRRTEIIEAEAMS